MKPREITIRIDTLVIEGAPQVSARDLRASLSAELERLIAERGLSPELVSGGAALRAPDRVVGLAPDTSAKNLGERAAQAVYSSLRPGPPKGARRAPRGGQS